jgi:glycosyltransferase involved in cell wall biosynthesis
MANYSVRMVSTFPTEGEGISQYTGYLISELKKRGVNVAVTKLYFLKSKRSTLKWLRLLFVKEQIVHVQYTPTGSGPLIYLFAALARCNRKKFILTSHEFPSTYGKHLSGVLRKLFYLFERMLYNAADTVTVHTAQHRDELFEIGVNPSKVTIVQFPVYPVVKLRTEEVQNIRHGIFFGRITPKKGIETLFEAIKKLPEDMTFSIIGPPAIGCEAYADTLKERAASMGITGRLTFSGFLDDALVASAIYKAGFAVFPYNYITQSAALMTIIGYGIPYIASDLPAFKEVYTDYKSGLLFKTGNADNLVETIVQCIDCKTHERLVDESAKAREKYNWQTYTGSIMAIYGN